MFVAGLLGCKFLKDPGSRTSDSAPLKRPLFGGDDYLGIVTYYFITLTNVLKRVRNGTNEAFVILATKTVTDSDERRKLLLERCTLNPWRSKFQV